MSTKKEQTLDELNIEYQELLRWKKITGDNSSTTLSKLNELEEKIEELTP